MASAYRPAFDDQDERDDLPVAYEASPVARSVVPPDPFHYPEYSRRETEPYRRASGPDSWQGSVSRQQTDPNAPWSQAKADLDDATAKLDDYGSTPKFMRHSEDGRVYSWALRDPATGQSVPTPYDTDDLIGWQRDGADLAARRDRARQAYDKLRPGTDRPEVIQSRIYENPPEPGRRRFQHWVGLPGGNGGGAALAGRAGDIGDEKSREQQPAASPASASPDTRNIAPSGAGDGAAVASTASVSPASFPPAASDQTHFYQKTEDAGPGLFDSNPPSARNGALPDSGGELKARDLAASKALESPPPFGRNAAQLEKNLVTGNIQVHERDVQGRWSSPEERRRFIEDYNARQIAPLQKAAREDQAMARQILERDGANQSHAARMKLVTDVGGSGTAMKNLSGVKSGFFESLKDDFNNPLPTNTSERIGDALARAGGDIPKAIGIIKSTPSPGRSSDFIDAESPFAPMPDEEDLAQATAGLQGLKDQFDKQGLTPEQQRAVVSDAAKAGYWTENDTDLVRQLSTGELRINPGFLFGDKQRIIDAVNGSGTDDIDKQIALLNLDSARERMQGRLFRATLTNDSGFQNFANSRWKVGGENDKAAILDAWAAQQKNRAWVFRAGDAVLEGVKYATVGLNKTLVGTGAGLLGLAGAGADLVGMDRAKRLTLRGAGYLGGVDNDMAGYLQGQKEAAVLRGQTGGFAFTSEVVSAVGQALPMLAGGEIAAGLKGVSQAVVSGMAIYGYGAAQGYEGSISDAITTARDRKGAPLTQEELGGILSDPKTQLGGFVSAIAAAALSKAFPNGVERAALGRAVPSMTVLDFVKGGGLDAMKKGAFGQEILAMGKTLFSDAKDQALQGFLNHIISEVGNAAAHGKDIRMGDLLAGAVDSAGVSIATSAVLTQGRKTDGRAPGREVPGGEVPPIQIPFVPAAPDVAPAKLGKMPPIYREVFESIRSGMTPQRVAEKLGISGKGVGNILKEIFSTRAAPASSPQSELPPPAGFSSDPAPIAKPADDTPNSAQPVPPDSAPGPGSLTASPDPLAVPPAALGKMPPIYQDVSEATRGGMTPSQVAEKFGISENRVGTILGEISPYAAESSDAITTDKSAADANVSLSKSLQKITSPPEQSAESSLREPVKELNADLQDEPDGNAHDPKKPTEAYNRLKHYGRTPTQADRRAAGAGKGDVADHQPPLVKRYYEGDQATGEKPGFQMTDAERRESARDRTRMASQAQYKSDQQGGQMSHYSKQKKKEHGL